MARATAGLGAVLLCLLASTVLATRHEAGSELQGGLNGSVDGQVCVTYYAESGCCITCVMARVILFTPLLHGTALALGAR